MFWWFEARAWIIDSECYFITLSHSLTLISLHKQNQKQIKIQFHFSHIVISAKKSEKKNQRIAHKLICHVLLNSMIVFFGIFFFFYNPKQRERKPIAGVNFRTNIVEQKKKKNLWMSQLAFDWLEFDKNNVRGCFPERKIINHSRSLLLASSIYKLYIFFFFVFLSFALRLNYNLISLCLSITIRSIKLKTWAQFHFVNWLNRHTSSSTFKRINQLFMCDNPLRV